MTLAPIAIAVVVTEIGIATAEAGAIVIAATATEMPRGTAVRDETVGRHVPMHRATQDRSPQHHGPIKGSVPSRRLEMNSPARRPCSN